MANATDTAKQRAIRNALEKYPREIGESKTHYCKRLALLAAVHWGSIWKMLDVRESERIGSESRAIDAGELAANEAVVALGKYEPPAPRPGSRRRAVERMLGDHPDWSNRKIGKEVGCGEAWIGSIRMEKTYRALGAMPTPGTIHLRRIIGSTTGWLKILLARVMEGKNTEGASEFCRWLMGSGILELIEAQTLEAPRDLRRAAREIIDCAADFWRTGKTVINPDELRSLQERMDRFEVGMAKPLKTIAPLLLEEQAA